MCARAYCLSMFSEYIWMFGRIEEEKLKQITKIHRRYTVVWSRGRVRGDRPQHVFACISLQSRFSRKNRRPSRIRCKTVSSATRSWCPCVRAFSFFQYAHTGSRYLSSASAAHSSRAPSSVSDHRRLRRTLLLFLLRLTRIHVRIPNNAIQYNTL